MPGNEQTADVIVIGLGPGGEEVASRLAEAGLAVVGIERELVGGECPYWGCIPSKMIVRGAETLAEADRVGQLAGAAAVRADYTPVARRIRSVTDSWDDTAAVQRFEKLGGRFVRGRGVLAGPRRVLVGETVFTATQGVVLATGSAPVRPPIPGLAEAGYWTNREAIEATSPPGSLIVLGGGTIGLELAQAFARFGSVVTVVEGADRVLPMEEPEASAVITAVLRGEELDLRTGRRAVAVSRSGGPATGGYITVALDDGSTVEGEQLLLAVGRHPDLRGLGLASVGLDEQTARGVPVDVRMRAAEGLWAVGDITGLGAFTHLAVHQARIAIADILGVPGFTADYTALPRVTFTDPEVGSVGRSESTARAAGIEVQTASAPVSASARGAIHGPGNNGVIKLVADADRDVLVGATSVGPRGGEVLAMLALAVYARLPISTLRSMIYPFPTFHRGILDALADLPA